MDATTDPGFDSLLHECNGDHGRLCEVLLSRRAELQAECEAIEAMLPGPGAVILDGEDAAEWAGFRALGLSPSEARAVLDERDTLRTEAAAMHRDDGDDWRSRLLARLRKRMGY